MWILYGLVAGIATALGTLVSKRSVSYVKDPWMRSFYFSVFFLMFIFPFAIFKFQLPKEPYTWLILFIGSAAVVIGNLFTFKAYSYLNPSTINVLHKMKLLWIILIGAVLLDQSIYIKDIAGMLLIIIASVLIVNIRQWKTNAKGFFSILIATIGFAGYAYSLIALSDSVDTYSLLILLTIIPILFYILLIKDLGKKIKDTYKNTKILILGAGIGVVYNLFMLLGIKEEPTKVFFIIESGIIIIIFGEYFWLNEKKNLLIKIGAVALALAGTIILR